MVAHPVQQVDVGLQELVGHVLGHVAQVGVFGPLHFARIGLQVGGQQAQQGRLADAVGADDGDLFAGVDHGRELADDGRVVGLGQVFDGDRQAVHDLVLLEADVRVLARRGLDHDLVGLDAVDLLQARGGLARLGLVGGEAAHEVLQFGHAFLGLGIVGHQALAGLGRGQHVIVVVARINADLAVIHVGHVRAHLVQEVAVVADDDHRALVAVEHVFQPTDGVDVQVVGRFVQQQHVRIREQGLRQQHAQLPARRHFAHRQVVLVDSDFQAQQQFAGAGFGGVAVVLGELGFQVGRAHVVVFGRFRIGVDGVALGHGGPHLGVTHHDDVQHAQVFKRELILAQLAQAHARLQRHVARRGFQVAADDLHEGRLAGTIGPDQPVAVAFPELDADVLEKGFGTELDGEIGGGDHGMFESLGVRGRMRRNPIVYQASVNRIQAGQATCRSIWKCCMAFDVTT
ncbi:Uncharacterised protein [Achromobacter aegrifaciens]|uniref:NAD-specific glutamate dehydrogenase n=1 Tax=Achromobacter aegrifaciens TaxID=1287736 RepID=A0AAD2QDB7_ACHAE|nr:Uncharacterised protein [Achromobacter aegrifaciens]